MRWKGGLGSIGTNFSVLEVLEQMSLGQGIENFQKLQYTSTAGRLPNSAYALVGLASISRELAPRRALIHRVASYGLRDLAVVSSSHAEVVSSRGETYIDRS